MTEITRVRKSEKLSKEEFSALRRWLKRQPTKFDACVTLDITRPTLDRILLAKSGSPESIQKIKSLVQIQA